MALIAAGPALPLAQPRNVLGGHVISATVGFAAVALLQFMELLVLAGIILIAFGVIGAQLDGKKYPVYWW